MTELTRQVEEKQGSSPITLQLLSHHHHHQVTVRFHDDKEEKREIEVGGRKRRTTRKEKRQVSVDVSWSLAKKELKYVDKKIALIRANSPTRLSAMLRIYIFFRDNHKADWRFPKLEAEKIVDLYKKVEAWTGSDQEETKEAETNPNLSHLEGIKLCRKCQTILHGNAGCPWSALSSTKAKKAARDFMKKMAKDTTEE